MNVELKSKLNEIKLNDMKNKHNIKHFNISIAPDTNCSLESCVEGAIRLIEKVMETK